MGIDYEGFRAFLPCNPFIPPKGDICFINNLPPEVLSRIFEIGAVDGSCEDEDDSIENYWEDIIHHLDAGDTDRNDLREDNAMMNEHNEEDEEETDEDDSDATGSSDLSSSWPPFEIVVSHVCRHWRTVALSTPSLWTDIVVGVDACPPYEHVSTLLERSKGLPIDIYLDFDPPDQDGSDLLRAKCDQPSEADFILLYSLLIPHIHRWHSIEVSVSEYHHIYVFLTAVSDPSISAAPQLASLELYSRDEMEDTESFGHPNMSKHFILFGGSAPCLTNVVLWGVHVDWNQSWIASASKLNNLELSYLPDDVRPSWSQFASILRGAPVLEKLSLRMAGPLGDPSEWFTESAPGIPADINAPISLLKVTDFDLAFQSPTRAIGMLRKLHLPALKNMVLDFDNGDYTDFVCEIAGPAISLSSTSAHEQSNSLLNRLVSLKITGLPCREECVETLYGELQNLTSLNISLSYLHRSYLSILGTPCTLAGLGDIWLPRLGKLIVTGARGDAVRKVVQKRIDAGVPLDSLYVEESSDVDETDIEWFKSNLKTFEFFEGSDDEDMVELDD